MGCPTGLGHPKGVVPIRRKRKLLTSLAGIQNAQQAAINQLETLNLAESEVELYKVRKYRKEKQWESYLLLGGDPNRVRASERSCSNPSEKKAANFISGYSNAQQVAINQLETLNLAESKVEVYKSHLREYPTWTTGVRKCHLRALYS